MTRKKLATTVAIGTLALGVVGGCSVGAAPTEEETTFVSLSWAETPTTLAELDDLAETVVRVRITGVSGTGNIDSTNGAPLPYTEFDAEVVERIAGDAADSIVIRQSGGSLDGVTYAIAEDPLMSPGEEYVLFLTEWAPGSYKINGGPSGRFTVVGDEVQPLESTTIVDESAQSQKLESFTGLVEELSQE